MYNRRWRRITFILMDIPTVIIPTRNNLAYLRMAIESLTSSTKIPFDLTVVESDCTDGTKEFLAYLEKVSHIKVIHADGKNSIQATNMAIRECKGDVFLTQDDMIFTKIIKFDWFEQMIKASRREDCGVVTVLDSIKISGPEYKDGIRWCGT